MGEGKPFEWISVGKIKTSWCEICNLDTKSKNDNGMVRCDECLHLKGVISG